MSGKVLAATATVTVILLVLLIIASPEVTSATTANATYIIETDNFTATIGDNLTITDLDTALSAAAEAGAAEMGDQLQDVVDSALAFLIMAGVTALAFWQRNVFLYLLAVMVDYIYGLTFASSNTVGSAAWVGGVTVAVIGTFCLFRAAMDAWPDIKAKMRSK